MSTGTGVSRGVGFRFSYLPMALALACFSVAKIVYPFLRWATYATHLPMALPLAGLAIAKILYSVLRWVTFADGKQGGFLEEDSEKPAVEDDVYPYADGINNLPDDILCNIVSRLEAIEASRTSILSRRWRKIWTMNPHLEFCCLRTLDSNVRHASCTYQRIFLKAVDQCLKLYSGKKLKRFFLGCCFLEDYTSHVEKWMRTIAKLGVEELFLCNPCTTNMRRFTFSFQLISGVSTLRKLKLSWCNVEPCFIGPFNSLVSLTFHRLALVRDELSGILLSCPNLQFLNVELCTLPLELRISGPSLKLEGLELLNCRGLCELYISAANLVSLNISSLTTVKLSLASVLKLESLYVKTAGTPYSFGHAMRDLPQLKHLFVYARIPAKDEIPQMPSTFKTFGKIRTLYLLMERSVYGASSMPRVAFQVDQWNIISIFSACPLLKEFYLMVDGPFHNKRSKVIWPTLSHKNLEYMELFGFSGTYNELEFAKFILRSAQVLQLLLLNASRLSYGGEHLLHSVDGVYMYPKMDKRTAPLIVDSLQEHALSVSAKVYIF